MKILCVKFPAVKFINIRSQQAVENWPEKNLPTLFCYNKGDLQVQLLTLNSVGGDSCREENLEWWMAGMSLNNKYSYSIKLCILSSLTQQKHCVYVYRERYCNN